MARWDGNEWKAFNLSSMSLVRCIVEEPAGALWAGTDGDGLCRIHDGQHDWFRKTNGLPSDSVNCLHIDADGILWAGTAGGLARLKAGKWASFAAYSELAGGIGYLLEDSVRCLWM